MSTNWQADVRAYHEKFGVLVQNLPQLPPEEVLKLRASLIKGRAGETIGALESGALADIATGLAHLVYVALGTAVSCGIDLDPIWELVHEANMRGVGDRELPDITGEILLQIKVGQEVFACRYR
ncbi:MAG: nucleoside triphosphate pyrophosphohydrolase family protein [Dehalococcoidia bacterium]|nr:nucleoside triphosphate pyrophosphohydrolase family protein [Dehalococcoidia bacterium]